MTDVFTKEKRSWIMARIKGRDTSPEKAVRSLLHSMGYRFRLHRRDLPGNPDIVLPGRGAVVLVHGCFWHGHTCKDGRRPRSNSEYWERKLSGNIERDARNARELRRQGWKRIVVWSCELQKMDRLRKRMARLLG